MANKTSKLIVMISGIDYPKFDQVKVNTNQKTENDVKVWKIAEPYPLPFQQYCKQWAENSLKKDKDVKVTYFDFENGGRCNLSIGKQGNVETSDFVTYGKPDFNNYRYIMIDENEQINSHLIPVKSVRSTIQAIRKPNIFYLPGISFMSKGDVSYGDYVKEYGNYLAKKPGAKFSSEKCVSITDVYQYILDVGKKNLSTKEQTVIVEIHFFSHSFQGGPILLNTIDFIDFLQIPRSFYGLDKKRNPLDYDGRAEFDFNPEDPDRGTCLKATDKDCKLFLWGCNRNDVVKNLILETLRLAPDGDDEEFKFPMKGIWDRSDELYSFYAHNLAEIIDSKELRPLPFTRQIVLELLDRLFIDKSYVQKICNYFNIRAIAPVLGTVTTNDEKGIDKNKFMHAGIEEDKLLIKQYHFYQKPQYDMLDKYLGFYSKYKIILGADLAHGAIYKKSGRGYGIYYQSQ